jgi:enamine deaminase RidA (YjgF/YER057c/UK114 family)
VTTSESPASGRRTEVVAPDLAHPQPIPVAIWINDTLHSSPIGPRQSDGSIPDGVEAQLDATFANLARLLDAADATPEQVGFVNVQLSSASHRSPFNERWIALFADEPRPARQVTAVPDLHAGVHVLLTVVAYR